MADLLITDVRIHPGDSGFLIDDGQTSILYDSGFGFTAPAMADRIQTILCGRKLDYIFLTHSHYDHALGSAYLRKCWPQVKVVAAEYAASIFRKPSAQNVMGQLDHKFAAKQGILAYEDLTACLEVDIPVKDADSVHAGSLRFEVVGLPGHTRCSVGFYLPENKLLLSCETLGVYDGVDTVVPSFLIGYKTTLESIRKARALDIQTLLLPHYGLLSRDKTQFYLESAEKSAVQTAEAIASILKAGGSKADAMNYFKDRFYHGYTKTVYPVDAMELNTGIMIDLIQKELCAG